MKKKNLLISASLALGVGVGVFAGIGLHNGVAEVDEVKAAGEMGTMLIDFTQSDWSSAACNVSLQFANSDWSEKTWGSYVAVAEGAKTISIPFTTTFDISKMILVRYNSTQSESDWSSSDRFQNVWNQTFDLTYSAGARTIVVGSWDGEYSKNNASVGNTVVMGGKSGSPWTVLGTLDGTKTNSSSHLEYYSDNVSLAKGQAFKIVYSGTYYGDKYATADSYVEDCFVINDDESDDDIAINETGVYSVYFDTTTKRFYLNDPVYAAADAWAQNFLGSGCTATKSGWATSAASFAELDKDVKDIFTELAYVDEKASPTTLHAKAVQRYDYVLKLYGVYDVSLNPEGYTDFMGRVGGELLLSKVDYSSSVTNGSNHVLTITVTAASIALLGTAGFFLLRRRKEN